MFEKIRRNDLISRALRLSGKKERLLDKEVVLSNVVDPNPLQKRIIELDSQFDLISFFQGVNTVETAVGLITPKQELMVECILVDVDDHGYNFQALYDAIYDYQINIIPISSQDDPWQSCVMKDSNIALQITQYGDFYVWCPEKIDEFQISILQKINKQLKEFQASNLSSLQPLFLDVYACIRSDDGKDISIEMTDGNLDKLLELYSSEDKRFKVDNHSTFKR